MIDLSTPYLGLPLANPLVASSSPLCESVDNIRAMEDAGAAAVVLHSLFEEQIDVESTHLDRYLTHGAESYAEALDYFPDLTSYNLGPDAYLEHVRRAKEAVEIPIIASLNGVSTGGWIELREADRAGRRRCAGAEHLLRPDRSGPDRRRGRAAVHRPGARREGERVDPGRRQARPAFSCVRQPRPPTWTTPARTGWCSSTASTSRTSTSTSWR